MALFVLLSVVAMATALPMTTTGSGDSLQISTPMVLIPRNATVNTLPGYWLDGSYTTIVTERGTLDFELSLSLHVPVLTTGAIYQTWHQIYDEFETLA